MKINKIHFVCILILISLSLYLVKDLFKPNFFTSHDGHHQLIRMAVFDQGIKDGQFPVRWAGSALEEYGYPLFVFTYRTPFIFGQILRTVFNLNYMWVVKLTFALTYLFSALTMFLALFDLTKKRLASLMGAFFYIIAPYRFSNIFVRASLGEASAFIFWPLIFWSIINLDKKKKWALLLGSISLALALMSHAMVFFIFMPFIAGVYLYKIIKAKKKLYFIKLASMQGALFLLLSAYYWVPAFFEKAHTVFDSVFSSHYDKHFSTFKQLLYSPWGYGFSMPGVVDDAMSFQVGVGQWLGVGLAVIFLLTYFFGKKKKINKEKKELMFLSLSFFAISIFAQGLIPLLARSFYAFEDTKTPMSISIFSICLNLILSWFLAQSLGVLGLALAFSISSIINMLLLYIVLNLKVRDINNNLIFNSLVKISANAIISGFIAYGALQILAN